MVGFFNSLSFSFSVEFKIDIQCNIKKYLLFNTFVLVFGVCSAKVRDGVRYCWKCQSDQTQVGPPSSKPSASSASCQQEHKGNQSERPRLSFGRPQNAPHGKVLTFDQFLKRKTSKENITTVRSSKKSKSNPNEEVTVFIGIKRLKDGSLKTVKGKRLPIRVPKSATCKLILQKAIEKMTAFDRSFDADEQYDLLFEDGSTALFMPGTKDFFELEKYRFELGRDYKRITFYLCTQFDIDLSEGIVKSSCEDEMVEEMDSCVQSVEESEVNTESVDGAQGTSTNQDEEIARQLQHEWNEQLDDLTSTSRSPEQKIQTVLQMPLMLL